MSQKLSVLGQDAGDSQVMMRGLARAATAAAGARGARAGGAD